MSPEGELTEEQLRENREDMPIVTRDAENEFIDDKFYEDRMTSEEYGKIEVPLLSAGNWVRILLLLVQMSHLRWSQGGLNLHLRGNVVSYLRAGSKYKFLRIHTGRHDLPYFQSPLVDMQLSFFDAFLKGDDHDGWKTGKEPPIRFAIRRGSPPLGLFDETSSFKWRAENEWPPSRTQYQKLYLQADKTLALGKASDTRTFSYEALT